MRIKMGNDYFAKTDSPIHAMRNSSGAGVSFFVYDEMGNKREVQIVGTQAELRDMAVALLSYIT